MAEESKGAGLRFASLLTVVPLVTAAFGGLQYYRDQQQREFQAITFYLQNQSVFDPCTDAQLASLNLQMIETSYPNVYARLVDHVENRASQCDSVTVISQEQTSAATAAPVTTTTPATNAPADAPSASAPVGGATRGIVLPNAPATTPAPDGATAPAQQPTRSVRMHIPSTTEEATAYFRNRYNRIASLPNSSARKVEDGRYRVFIQISNEGSRAEAVAVSEGLKKDGHTSNSIELVPVRVTRPELRYYREDQAADAQKMADTVKAMLAAQGDNAEVTTVFIGQGRPGLPPGTMELWLP